MVGNYKKSIRAHVIGELEERRFDKRWATYFRHGIRTPRKLWKQNRRGYKG